MLLNQSCLQPWIASQLESRQSSLTGYELALTLGGSISTNLRSAHVDIALPFADASRKALVAPSSLVAVPCSNSRLSLKSSPGTGRSVARPPTTFRVWRTNLG